MRRNRLGWALAPVFAAAFGAGMTAAGPPPSASLTGVDDPLPALAATVREGRLRMRESRPDVPPELRRFGGPLHAAMTEAGRLVAARRLSRKEAVSLLGPPDETVRAGESLHGKPVPTGETHLVYWWRGGHDTLVLVVRKETVVAERWWFAGD